MTSETRAPTRAPVGVPHDHEALDPVAATLWEIERDPRLRTTIVAVLLLDRPVERAALLDGLGEATRVVPRLRQRVVERPNALGGPYWATVADFDLTQHVDFVDTDGPVDDARLAAVVEPLANVPLDRHRPQWAATYVGGPSGRAALVLRIHHAVTDGVGGVDFLDAVLDGDRERARPGTASEGPGAGASDRARRLAGLPLRTTQAMAGAARHPLATAGAVQGAVASARRLLAPSSAPLSPLMVDRSEARHIGMVDADLDRLRDAAHARGCTINHVFFAAVLGALAEYHRAHDRPAEQLRVTVPVNLRRADDPRGGNRWAPVRLVVPAAIEDPLDRLLALRDVLDGVRREPALPISDRLAGVLGRLPAQLTSAVVGGMMQGVDLTLTNVPGLRERRFLRGAEVERIYAFAPTAGAALNAALVSHAGRACIGLLSDAAAVSDPALLRDLVQEHLEDVLRVAEVPDADRLSALESRSVRPTPAERLSALDTAFLRVERPELPMHIGGIMFLEGPPLRDAAGRLRIGEVRAHIAARLRHLPRFRRRIVEVPLGVGRPEWVDDEDFDIERHVRQVTVPPPGGRRDLLRLAASLFDVPLDRGAPLWELWVVDGLADGTVAIVEKVHHALIDGASGVELATLLFDLTPGAPREEPMWLPRAVPDPPVRRALGAAAERLADPLRVGRRVGETLVRRPEVAVGQVRSGVAGIEQVLGAATTVPLPFNGTVGRRRALAARHLDRDRLDRLRRPLGATLNDVVLHCVAGALTARYGGIPGRPDAARVLMPMSTRQGGMRSEPGNHVGAAIVDLPLDDRDPASRLSTVMERTRHAKEQGLGEGAAAVLAALDHLPPITDRALADLLRRHTLVHLVVTNVKGSPVPLYLLGAKMLEAIPIVPLGPRLGLGVAVLSYTDQVVVSLFADPELFPAVDEFADLVLGELADLAELTEGDGDPRDDDEPADDDDDPGGAS